jgi:uncharacterized protein YwgA
VEDKYFNSTTVHGGGSGEWRKEGREEGEINSKEDMALYGYTSLMAAATVVLLNIAMFTSCGHGHEGQHMQTRVDRALDDIDRDRNAVRTELVDLRKDIDLTMIRVEEELQQEDLADDQRREKEQLLRELESNRNRVQQALLELEHADDGAWMHVRKRSKDLTRSVDNWFERQAEKEDMQG